MKLNNIFKKFHSTSPTHERDREVGVQIFRDWGIVVASFVALILIVICIDGYLLFRVNQGNFFAVDPEVGVSSETLNRKTLLNVSSFFETRQKEYESLKSATTTQIDPSL